MLFAALWLTATTVLLKPGQDGLGRAGRNPLGRPRLSQGDSGPVTLAPPGWLRKQRVQAVEDVKQA